MEYIMTEMLVVVQPGPTRFTGMLAVVQPGPTRFYYFSALTFNDYQNYRTNLKIQKFTYLIFFLKIK